MRHPLHWIALAGFALIPAFSARVAPNDYRGGFSRDRADTEARNSNAIAMILGEFRSNMSDLIFIKTERYLHAGVGYAPHIDMSRLASTGEVAARSDKGATKPPEDAHDHDHDHDHGHEHDDLPNDQAGEEVPGHEGHDHTPVHGGQFFMSNDYYHHVEGVLVSPTLFRLFIYDDRRATLDPSAFPARIELLRPAVNPDDPPIVEPLPLGPEEGGRALVARLPEGLAFPVEFDAFVEFPKADTLFTFHFDALTPNGTSTDPVPEHQRRDDHVHDDHVHDDHAHEDHDHDHAHAHDHDHDHAGEGKLLTIIPTARQDFRGFVGWLERNVKPWRDPSEPDEHGSGDEILPWYRVMTFADPHNVRGYLIGAWWLKAIRSGEKAEEALAFLEEGIRNNPDAFQLHLHKGYLLNQKFGNLAAARPVFRRAAELAMKARPDDPEPGSLEWTSYDEDDAGGAFRMAVLSEKEVGNHAEALRLARRYLAKLKRDGSLERQIRELEAEANPGANPAPGPVLDGPPAPELAAPPAPEEAP